ncbi:MAG: hypothetical protein ACYTGB_07495, partial [Planctomycetota bacterium]
QQLWKLHHLGADVFREETCRLLDAGSPVLVAGAIVSLQNHGESRDRTVRDALTRAVASEKFPAASRVAAFHLLRRGGVRSLRVGGKRLALASILDPLLENPKTAEEFNLAVLAAQALQGHGMKGQALARVRELAANEALPAMYRPQLVMAEISLLCVLGRWKEADGLVGRLLAGAKTEAEIQGPVQTVFWTHLNRGNAVAAEKLTDALFDRFPESAYAASLCQNLIQNLRTTGRTDAAAGIAARLFAKAPADFGWAKSHANFLAAKGKFRDAAAALRRCLKLNPVLAVGQTGDEGETKSAEREVLLRRRHVLVMLLARVCAQDADLRAAFMREADAAAADESPALRTWTEAALACLDEAADYEKLIARLEKLGAEGADDTRWLARLADARLRAGDEAGAAREYEKLFEKQPERYDLAFKLHGLALRANDAGAAESWMKKAMDVLERNSAQLYNMAWHWQNSGRYELAFEAFKRLLKTGNYAGRGSVAWGAVQSARALGRVEDEVKFMARAARDKSTGHAGNFIQRIGKLFEDPASETAARRAARKAFDDWKAEIGTEGPAWGGDAYYAAELALRLELWDDATNLYVRAARAAERGHASAAVSQLCGLSRNPKARKTAEPRALKLLEEWRGRGSDLPRALAGPAKQLAEFMGRRDDAIHFFALAIPASSGGPRGTATELIRLADTPERRKLVEKLFVKAVSAMPKPRREIWTHLFRWKVALSDKDSDVAGRELSAAAEVEIPRGEPNLIPEVCGALAEAKEKDRLLQYVLAQAKRLEDTWKINVLASGVSLLGDNDERSLRLRRTLVEIHHSNRQGQRRGLIDCLVRMGRLEEAAAEMKRMEVGRNAYYVRATFERVVNAFWNTGKRDQQRRAMELALWGWRRLNRPEAQGYGRDLFTRLISMCDQAQRKGRLDEKFAAEVVDSIRSSCRRWFDLDEEEHWFPNYWSSHGFLEKRKLGPEIDAMAAAAAASDDVDRVVRGAQYYQSRGATLKAREAWRRVLSLGGYNERSALSQLYSLCSQGEAPDWEGALECVERLREMGVYRGSSYRSARLPCLYGLKRRKEARETLKRLLSPEERIENLGYGWFDSLAHICERGGDWEGAAEAWEASVRLWRFYSARQRGDYWHNIMQAYRRAAMAYAKTGDGEKSLECCLRGLSVIPRDSAESYYRQLMEHVIRDLLKAKALEKAIAEYEKGVEAGGGVEKPHLRVAFAEACTRAGKQAEALRHLRIAAELMPKDLKLRERVIAGYRTLKDQKGVIGSYLDWARIDPQNIRIYSELGDYYKSLGREEEAWAAWATMAEVRPREAEGYRWYATKLANAGRDAEAASALRKALRHRPTEFAIAEELAAAYRRLKQSEKIKDLWAGGEKACRRAMKDFADDPLPWLNLVRFLKAQGRRDEARDLCDRICRRRWPRFHGETVSEAHNLRKGL